MTALLTCVLLAFHVACGVLLWLGGDQASATLHGVCAFCVVSYCVSRRRRGGR